jgi:hypothetical protein
MTLSRLVTAAPAIITLIAATVMLFWWIRHRDDEDE